uniref:Ribonuclease H-like domain-containing protein n=1 Tax=Tanacetum cinerariifolium TaxID=118510 RepID=A0A6L2MVR2_TANCI|nr:ribonuclease H-like domain-containing protein [Tanacetum cinerariifolium]
MTDYSLWEVIFNGDSLIPTRVVDGVVQPVAPTTAEKRDNESAEDFLKQHYENFTGSSSESLDQIHDRLQKLIIQLEILDLEDQSLDDLFNNLKIYEAGVKSSSSTSPTTQNIAFVSSQNTDNTNESVSAVTSVSAANADDLEEMDLKWQMAMLTIREKRFLQRTRRNLGANGTTSIGFDMSKVECYNCHRKGHFARECRSAKDTRKKDTQRRNVPVETSTSNALVLQCDGVGLEYVEARIVVYQQNENVFEEFEEDIKLLKLDVMLRDNALVELRKKFKTTEQERDELKLKLEKFQTSLKNLSKLLASQITNKTGLGYANQVFNSTMFDCDELISSESDVSMPPSPVHDRPDLVFHDSPTASETVLTVFNVEPSTTKPNKVLSQSHRPSAPIVKDWVSNLEDEYEGEPMPTQKAPSFVQTSEHVKTPRLSVKLVEHPIPADNLRKDIPKSRGHRHSWNRKACFVCKSLTYLIKDCDYYEKKMDQRPVRNHAMRGNHQHYARMTHPYPHRHVVPTTVLTRSRLVPFTTARPVTTAVPQTKVQHQRPTKHGVNKAHSPIRRPINLRPSPKNSNFYQKVTTVKANQGTYIISLTLKKIMEDMLLLVEIQKVVRSQAKKCDKKNNVLFTDTECIVLSSDFKLPDENHVLLRVPKENNIYNVDLKDIVPSGDLTCLFAKATLDESNL